jgi:hypothetical protein
VGAVTPTEAQDDLFAKLFAVEMLLLHISINPNKDQLLEWLHKFLDCGEQG